MKRRWILLAGLIPTCWWGMMLVHECGHTLAAVASGGSITRLEFPLWGFSRTDVFPNPHPLVVVWGGPVLGACLPWLGTLVLRATRRPSVALGIFSGFCLLANGVYLAVGSLGRIGDAAEMLKLGAPIWSLWIVGLPMVAVALAQWHFLGPVLGLRRAGTTETILTAALGVLLLCAAVTCQIASC